MTNLSQKSLIQEKVLVSIKDLLTPRLSDVNQEAKFLNVTNVKFRFSAFISDSALDHKYESSF